MSGLILNPKTPEVFAPLWERHARYKGAYGGRGSAKSNDRAQAVILRMITDPGVRIACVREVQLSIKDSVRQLLVDWIQRLDVGHLFTVVEAEIRGPGGSLCIFRGMNDQSAESIKSLEGFSVFWWEEAQTASAKSLKLLRPTMRAAGGEMWFTWNPRKKSDPIEFLRTNPPPGAIVVQANFCDNPWFPEDLEKERQIDLAGDEDYYRHVWLGAYEAASDMQFISASIVGRARETPAVSHSHDELILGVDVARGGDDRSVIAVRRGRDARTEKWLTFDRLDLMQFAAQIAATIDRLNPDGVFIDEGGVGGGVIDRLRQLGYHVTPVNSSWAPDGYTKVKTRNKRAEMWQRMREWLEQDGVAIPDADDIEIDLTGPLYKYDVNNAIQLESKEEMKKRGVRSPDMADALALTFAFPVSPRGEHDRQEEGEEYDPFSWR